MAAGQVGVQIGQAGYARAKGIPGMTVTWVGPSATTRTAKVFNSFRKRQPADVSDSHGNRGEWLSAWRRNKRIEIQIEAVAVGAKASDAASIADDLPVRNDLVAITGATDTSLNTANVANPDYIVTSDPETSKTPDGDAVISMTLTCILNDDNSHIIPVVLAET